MEPIHCPIECIRGGCPDAPDFIERNGTFLLTVIGSLSGILGVCLSYMLKSRCKNIKTPCLSCDRDVVSLQPDQVAVEVASAPHEGGAHPGESASRQ